MTVTNKKSNPDKFDARTHSDKQVDRQGSAYLLRLIANPNEARWVVFPKKEKSDS